MADIKNNKREKDLKISAWTIDGFVGVLALMIYNFLLYLLSLLGVGGIFGRLEDAMGYFGLNTFTDFGLNPNEMFIGIVTFLLFSFLLGVVTGNLVRKRKKYKR